MNDRNKRGRETRKCEKRNNARSKREERGKKSDRCPAATKNAKFSLCVRLASGQQNANDNINNSDVNDNNNNRNNKE